MKGAAIDSALAAAENAGLQSGREYCDCPSRMPDGELGAFSDRCRFSALLIRRVLLRAAVPPRWLGLLRPLVDRAGRLDAFDNFLRRYAYWRGVRRGIRRRELWRRLQRGPVILMYHAIGRSRSEHASLYVVPERRFRAQMAWLKWRGYHVLSLADLVDCFRARRLPPARSVVITFDDGYADNDALATPILRRYGFSATVFAVSGAVGSRAMWLTDPPLANREMVSLAQVKAMAAAGWGIGAHTQTHPSLPSLGAQEQQAEIVGSRNDLDRLLGRPVVAFAYPFGDYTAETASIVERAGFHAACCSRSGINDPGISLFELRRVEVRGTDRLFDFAMMLWRGHRRRVGRPSTQLEHATV